MKCYIGIMFKDLKGKDYKLCALSDDEFIIRRKLIQNNKCFKYVGYKVFNNVDDLAKWSDIEL